MCHVSTLISFDGTLLWFSIIAGYMFASFAGPRRLAVPDL